MTRRALAIALVAAIIAMLAVRPVAACSPPFNPTIEELGPAQVVVIGTTGERVAGGRLFHVVGPRFVAGLTCDQKVT